MALLEDLRKALNSAEQGLFTRITGELRFKEREPKRFWQTIRVERVEFENTSWGTRLTEFAELPSGWSDATGAQISFVALDALHQLLKRVEALNAPLPVCFRRQREVCYSNGQASRAFKASKCLRKASLNCPSSTAIRLRESAPIPQMSPRPFDSHLGCRPDASRQRNAIVLTVGSRQSPKSP